jgi:polar amino acid transport system substrate-binding protein
MKNSLIGLITLILIASQFSSCNSGTNDNVDQKKESVYDRVTTSGKIRAAYTIYPPGCMKDSTGKLSGVFVETLEEACKLLDLKVEWTEEVGWATQIEGLETNRYDMIGSSVWANPKRAKLSTLSNPLYFSPIYIYIRSNDNRFANLKSWAELNQENIRIATIDGGTGEQIAKSQFEKAQRIALPQLTDFGQSFLDVVHNKADIIFMEPFHASKFLESNPNSIKNIVHDGKPLRTFGNCYMFRRDEPAFEHMLNVVLQDLLNSGFVEQLIVKYEKYPHSYSRVTNPYILK